MEDFPIDDDHDNHDDDDFMFTEADEEALFAQFPYLRDVKREIDSYGTYTDAGIDGSRIWTWAFHTLAPWRPSRLLQFFMLLLSFIASRRLLRNYIIPHIYIPFILPFLQILSSSSPLITSTTTTSAVTADAVLSLALHVESALVFVVLTVVPATLLLFLLRAKRGHVSFDAAVRTLCMFTMSIVTLLPVAAVCATPPNATLACFAGVAVRAAMLLPALWAWVDLRDELRINHSWVDPFLRAWRGFATIVVIIPGLLLRLSAVFISFLAVVLKTSPASSRTATATVATAAATTATGGGGGGGMTLISSILTSPFSVVGAWAHWLVSNANIAAVMARHAESSRLYLAARFPVMCSLCNDPRGLYFGAMLCLAVAAVYVSYIYFFASNLGRTDEHRQVNSPLTSLLVRLRVILPNIHPNAIAARRVVLNGVDLGIQTNPSSNSNSSNSNTNNNNIMMLDPNTSDDEYNDNDSNKDDNNRDYDYADVIAGHQPSSIMLLSHADHTLLDVDSTILSTENAMPILAYLQSEEDIMRTEGATQWTTPHDQLFIPKNQDEMFKYSVDALLNWSRPIPRHQRHLSYEQFFQTLQDDQYAFDQDAGSWVFNDDVPLPSNLGLSDTAADTDSNNDSNASNNNASINMTSVTGTSSDKILDDLPFPEVPVNDETIKEFATSPEFRPYIEKYIEQLTKNDNNATSAEDSKINTDDDDDDDEINNGNVVYV